ncbi:MAG TPA: hypothetical protein VEX38_01835 [Fimbriimonadaceae bacterium]|nr:hypothetical protein [Fimbriimonadaceae bacterium]
MKDNERENPIREFFALVVHESLCTRAGLQEDEEVEAYIAEMLIAFLHQDHIFAIRNANGEKVESIAEMLVEGDVRLNADSFEREREVHKHIGDFLLFWSGLYPEFLRKLKSPGSKDLFVDFDEQGKYSYHVVSTFDHDPYSAEAPIFRKLSAEFEAYKYGLSLVRASFSGFAAQGWVNGFEA